MTDLRKMLCSEPATEAEKKNIMRTLGEITARNVKCPVCGKNEGIDFDHADTHFDLAEPTVYTTCQHCGSYTYLEFPHLFTDEVEPEEMYGERHAVSRKEMLRDILHRQLEKVEAMPEF